MLNRDLSQEVTLPEDVPGQLFSLPYQPNWLTLRISEQGDENS